MYWHELTNSEQDEEFHKLKTINAIMAKYEKPDWCLYNGNHNFIKFCHSLASGEIHSKEDCGKCKYKKEVN